VFASVLTGFVNAHEINPSLGKSVYPDDPRALTAKLDVPKQVSYDGPFGEVYYLDIILDKSSIMPVYCASLLDFAKTGSFVFKPNEYAQTYYANIWTPEGEFAGNVDFNLSGDHPTIGQYMLARQNNGWNDNNEWVERVYSHNYADFAERVSKLMNKNELIPPSQVRYVMVAYLGTVFYVNDGKTEAFIAVDNANGNVFNEKNGGIVYFDDAGLKAEAERVLKEETEYQAYLAAGGEPLVGGGGDYPLFTVKNVVAQKPLSEKTAVKGEPVNDKITASSNTVPQRSFPWVYIIPLSLVVIAVAGFVLYRRYKTIKQQ